MPPDWLLLALVALLAMLVALVGLRARAAAIQVARMLLNLETGRPVRRLQGIYPGQAGRLVAVFNEVGPELQARHERLEADRHLLEIVLEGMTEGVLAVDGRRRLLFANRAAIELFGIVEGSTGRLLAEAIRSPELQRAVEATLETEEPQEEEFHIAGSAAPGERRMGRILSVRGRRLAGSAGAVLVLHDVTELRRLERMRQDFVANASHELKTPLAAIQALTETLIDGAIEDAAVNRDFLRRIEEQTHRLNELVLDMLRLARLDSGQETFRHGPLAVAPMLRACYDNHQGRALARGLRLTLHAGKVDESVQVRADAEAVRQILDNLLDNAIKYTPEGGRISLNARATADRVVIEVADTGIGIPRAELPRIFERFYRVDKGRGRSMGGTGLGLSIVWHLVQALGGRISVESRVNAGSLFRVDLPRQVNRADTPAEATGLDTVARSRSGAPP
jgi:two-component system phosphate regulon sensor histidine kinase PhoR